MLKIRSETSTITVSDQEKNSKKEAMNEENVEKL